MLPFLSPLAAVSVLTRILGVMIPSDTLSSVDRGKREEHQAPTNWALAPGTLYFLKVYVQNTVVTLLFKRLCSEYSVHSTF